MAIVNHFLQKQCWKSHRESDNLLSNDGCLGLIRPRIWLKLVHVGATLCFVVSKNEPKGPGLSDLKFVGMLGDGYVRLCKSDKSHQIQPNWLEHPCISRITWYHPHWYWPAKERESSMEDRQSLAPKEQMVMATTSWRFSTGAESCGWTWHRYMAHMARIFCLSDMYRYVRLQKLTIWVWVNTYTFLVGCSHP
jgi:hypothetical protein